MNLQFHNPHQPKTRRTLLDLFLWAIGYYDDPIPLAPVPPDFVFPNVEETLVKGKPVVSWINHSTFLIEAFGVYFLSDPIWNTSLAIVGPKRHFPPPCAIKDLPSINYVIISHDHYDHLDRKTIGELVTLFPRIIFIVPKGVKKWFTRHFKDEPEVIELNWWESCSFSYENPGLKAWDCKLGRSPLAQHADLKDLRLKDRVSLREDEAVGVAACEGEVEVTFTAVPAQHFSGRIFFGSNTTLWMGCVVEIKKKSEKKCFYFAGDTGYNKHDFNEIGKKWGGVDLALLPIGAYTPRAFMSPIHINPEEAVKIHKEVHSKLSVGGHFGTFKLASESLDQPPYDLFLAMQKERMASTAFCILKPGQKIQW